MTRMGASNGRRIAVVDDDPIWLARIGHALIAAGYRVQLIGDPEHALEAMLERPPDVLVCEHAMTGNGIALARAVRERLGPRGPAIVLVTGDVLHLGDDVVELFAAAFEKPIPMDMFLAEMRRLAHARGGSGPIATAAIAGAAVPPPSTSDAERAGDGNR